MSEVPESSACQFGLPALHADCSELTRAEYITALVHFYRAEMYRATQWRMRLDTTTNWSILATTAVVTFSFGERQSSHASLIVGMLMVLTFLLIEARRYRIFDVWRERTRVLEKSFIGPILRGDPTASMSGWGTQAAESLDRPEYNISWSQAVRARLVRNYLPLFALMLGCWLIKLNPAPRADMSPAEAWLKAMEVGPLPGWLVGGFVGVHYLWLLLLALAVRAKGPEEDLRAHPEIAVPD
ncbi:MAG: hypothetical protein CMJ58_06405 [Planctomycetaceae bacterium]|nr:hypothetical protein [Planctomycetaceae bacterium]